MWVILGVVMVGGLGYVAITNGVFGSSDTLQADELTASPNDSVATPDAADGHAGGARSL